MLTGVRPYDAIILAGGSARRMGGVDKPGVRIGGRSLLERVLAACEDAGRRIVVGWRRPLPGARGGEEVLWTREDPPGGGPVAALEAGVRLVTGDRVLVVAGDMPFVREGTVRGLLAAARDDGAVLTDEEGRDQPLAAVYGTASLRRELARLAGEYGSVSGLSLRLLTSRLTLHRVRDREGAAFDCDTWDDVTLARVRLGEDEGVLENWIAEVKSELGIELDVDTATLLDVARDAAHGVARPAAPLTTFLVGYAAGRAGGDPAAVAEAARKAQALALAWEERERVADGQGERTP